RSRQPIPEQLVIGPVRVAHQFHEPPPLIFLNGNNEDLTIAAICDEPWTYNPIAKPRGHSAGISVMHQVIFDEAGNHFAFGDIDALAVARFALMQVSRERYHRRMHTSLEITLVTKAS